MKKLEANAKKKDCGDIRLWTKSSVNHCYWVAASSGDNGEMKEQKWASLVEHVANKHDNCQHGELDEDRQWLREGETLTLNVYCATVQYYCIICTTKLKF